MRLSELLHQTVLDSEGKVVGKVQDVRLTQEDPQSRSPFVVSGLIVDKVGIGSMLGYERTAESGPWLVRQVVLRLHRNAKFVPWADVAEIAPTVKLGVLGEQLSGVPPIDDAGERSTT